jgi:hypothetical protein
MATISSLSNFSVPINGADNTGLLMPKLKYRFKITFDGLGLAASDTTELTKQVVKAARPNVDFENKVIDVYNSKINYAGKPTWKPISVTLRDDSTGIVNRVVGEQNQKQFDFFEQSSSAAAGDYKFRMTINVLDGGNAGNFKDPGSILETWECYGCYIQSTTFGELTYSDAGAMEIVLSIQPDNCVQTAGGAIGAQGTDRVVGSSLMGGSGVAP